MKKTLDLFIGLSEKDILKEKTKLINTNQDGQALPTTTPFFCKLNQFFLELDRAFSQCVYQRIERMDSCALAEILNDLVFSLANSNSKLRNKNLLNKLDYLMELAESYAKNYPPDDPNHDRLRKEIPQLMEIYSALNTSLQLIANTNLKKTVSDYRAHLKSSLIKEGVMSKQDIIVIKNVQCANVKWQLKLFKRYEVMDNLDKQIQSKTYLEESDLSIAKEAFNICMTNYADWSERQFIQKVTDVLSLGIKPLYRAFLSQEKIYVLKAHETLKSIEPRNMLL